MRDLDTYKEEVSGFCERWHIVEFSFFGSVLRPDMQPESDVDVLIELPKQSHYDLLDLVQMQEELETLFGRHVDLVEKEAIRNPYRRQAIFGTRRIVYAS